MELKMLPFAGCLLLFFLHCASSEVPSFLEVPASSNLNRVNHGRHTSHHRVNGFSRTHETERTAELKSDNPNTIIGQTTPWGYTEFSGCNLGFNTAYRFHPIKKTWLDAKFSCYEEGGYLAYPDCAAEEKIYNDYLTLLDNGGAWLGMSDRHQEGDWITMHNLRVKNLSYVNWAPTEPNNYGPDGEDCAELYVDGKWYDMDCEKKLYYICKRDLPLNNAPSVQHLGPKIGR